jgi:hypothetical protein
VARTGAVTLIQRSSSGLDRNIRYHMLFLDGVYVERPDGSARFWCVKAPTSDEWTQLAHAIARRVGRFLERQGLLERDADRRGRVAVGRTAGTDRKVAPGCGPSPGPGGEIQADTG